MTEPGVEAKAGEYIVAIDGVPTNSVNDMYKLLIGKANVPTELSLNSKPQLAGARKIVVSPLAEEYSLYHYNNLQGLCTNLHSKQQVLRHDDNHTSHSNTLFHRKDEYEF